MYYYSGKQVFLRDKSSYTEASFIFQIFSHKTYKKSEQDPGSSDEGNNELCLAAINA